MRHLYTLMWCLALPLVLARLWWRGRQERGYRLHWGERLGWYGARAPRQSTLWVHAVSVGETRAAEPLIDALMAQYPDSRIVLTHMTPTGRETGKALFAKHGARLVQAYLPYDIPFMIGRFIAHFGPRICILMETEVWPNLIAACGSRVPVALVNARLSDRSLRRGQRFGRLMRDAAGALALVAAQTEADAARVRLLGAPRVEVTGSVKFDVVVPPAALALGAALRARIGARQVLLCASTRDGEEALLLDAWVAADLPGNPLLLIVPRHPQRFDAVAALVEASGLTLARRSRWGAVPDAAALAAEVWLGDSMQEMALYYATAQVALLGGSFEPLGGQNLIEAAACGCPLVMGPHTFNFAAAAELSLAAGAAKAGLSFAAAHRGAARKTADAVLTLAASR